MQVSAIVYNDTNEGESWCVAWNDACYRCTVTHLSEQDLVDIRDQSFPHEIYLDQADEEVLFNSIEDAHAYFHHGTEQWRRAAANRLFHRIDPAKFPAA